MAHWRDTSRNVKFGFVDYRACFPLLVLLLHIRLWTFIFAVVCITFFALIEHYGFSVPVFSRWLRSFLAGPRKISQPWWRI